MRKVILLAAVAWMVPFVFYGCSGDDGATGATGATGPGGDATPAFFLRHGPVSVTVLCPPRQSP